METVSMNKRSRIAPDISSAMRQWFRFSEEAVDEMIKMGQPLLEVYLKGLGTIMPALKNLDLKNINDLYCRKNCEIPETECPPYCVCEMEWDACEGETVTGSIDMKNTGQQTANFSISAATFQSVNDNSGITPQFTPASFVLAPNETKTIGVTIKVESSFDPSVTYTSQAKVRGRYEQCVLLKLRVRRKSTPYCSVEQGEIPKRIVAHNWYDHFQCEELCFQPVGRTFEQPTGEVIDVKRKKATTKKPATATATATAAVAKGITRKRATKRKTTRTKKKT